MVLKQGLYEFFEKIFFFNRSLFFFVREVDRLNYDNNKVERTHANEQTSCFFNPLRSTVNHSKS